jgi:hypothetical protein
MEYTFGATSLNSNVFCVNLTCMSSLNAPDGEKKKDFF